MGVYVMDVPYCRYSEPNLGIVRIELSNNSITWCNTHVYNVEESTPSRQIILDLLISLSYPK